MTEMNFTDPDQQLVRFWQLVWDYEPLLRRQKLTDSVLNPWPGENASEVGHLWIDYSLSVDPTLKEQARQRICALLTFYSILEIGCVSGMLTVEVMPDAFKASALQVLAQERVSELAARLDGVNLPQRLRTRLSGRSPFDDVPPEQGAEFFTRLLDLHAFFRLSEDTESFIRMVRGAKWNGVHQEDFLAVFKDPQECLARAFVRDKQAGSTSELDSAIRGFFEFLEFAHALDELLIDSMHLPRLQEVMWGLFSEEFDVLGERLRATVFRVFDLIKGWPMLNGTPFLSSQIEAPMSEELDEASSEIVENLLDADLRGVRGEIARRESIDLTLSAFERLLKPALTGSKGKSAVAAFAAGSEWSQADVAAASARWRAMRSYAQSGDLGRALGLTSVRAFVLDRSALGTQLLGKAEGDIRVLAYESTRLLFRRDILDALNADDVLVVKVRPQEPHPLSETVTYAMTRAEAEQTFSNVFKSFSYRMSGRYSYPVPPRKAARFIVIP